MMTATMRKVRKAPSPNHATHQGRRLLTPREARQKAIAEQKWDWSYAMLLGIWRMLKRAGVSGEEIVEEVTGYLEVCNRTKDRRK